MCSLLAVNVLIRAPHKDHTMWSTSWLQCMQQIEWMFKGSRAPQLDVGQRSARREVDDP